VKGCRVEDGIGSGSIGPIHVNDQSDTVAHRNSHVTFLNHGFSTLSSFLEAAVMPEPGLRY
jgi:hypothetical protein